MRERPALVLVHSPLTGPLPWRQVAGSLKAMGHTVTVPNLTEALTGNSPFYPRLAGALAADVEKDHGDRRIILIGHSGAGPLLPAVAERTIAKVIGMIFVDATLPHPGRSELDAAPAELGGQLRRLAADGLLPPWNEWFPPGTIEALLPGEDLRTRLYAELPRLPLAYFEEPAPALPDPAPSMSAYLRLSDVYEPAALQAERASWFVTRRSTHHLAMLTEPDEIGATLDEMIDYFGT